MTEWNANTFVWTGKVAVGIAPGGAGVTNYPSIVGGNMSDSPFRSVAPKVNNLNVVKLTKDNLVTVAQSLIRKGGPSVSVKADYFTYGTEHTGQTFGLGEFIVKEYDYAHNREFFRAATLEERKKYDLR